MDDWAWQRGERYGSILVDREAGRPVDLLPERTAAALEQWLTEHPGVEVIVRDRSTEYARGATAGAPAATQVVDRWHVLRNVREVAARVLDRHAADLRGLPTERSGAGLPPRRRSMAEEARRAAVREQIAAHHAEIQRLTAAGETISGIARRLAITRIMVRRYRFAAAPPQRDYARRASQLDAFESYLRRRWAEGCRNGLQLWRALRECGYTGASRPVSRWAQERRTAPTPSTPHRHLPADNGATTSTPAARRPAVPTLAWLLVRDPGGLDDAELRLLDRLRAACAPAATAYPLLQQIARMIREQDPLPGLHPDDRLFRNSRDPSRKGRRSGTDSRNSAGMGLLRDRFLPDLDPIGLLRITLHANCGRAGRGRGVPRLHRPRPTGIARQMAPRRSPRRRAEDGHPRGVSPGCWCASRSNSARRNSSVWRASRRPARTPPSPTRSSSSSSGCSVSRTRSRSMPG